MALELVPRLELTAQRFRSPLAWLDLEHGVSQWPLWMTMAWFDIKMRYRRSVLGPFWLTLSMAVMVATMGLMYGALLGIDLHVYLPFLTLGFLGWGYISGVIMDACHVFILSEHFIKQIRLPYSVFVYRVVCRQLLILAHNMLVYVVVAVIFGIWPGVNALWILPGLLLIVLNSVWMIVVLGVFCTRFRDIPQIVQSLVQVIFFLTPIMWTPELMKNRPYVVDANPFHHFLELFRAPLLGHAPDLLSWEVALGVTVAGSLAGFVLFRRYRDRIAFWL